MYATNLQELHDVVRVLKHLDLERNKDNEPVDEIRLIDEDVNVEQKFRIESQVKEVLKAITRLDSLIHDVAYEIKRDLC